MASSNLPLIPAPKRSGAKHTRALCITSNALSAQPLIKNPDLGLLSAVAFGGGYDP